MCNITIPNSMLSGTLNVTIDGEQPLSSAPPVNDGTYTSLYFTYNSTKIPHTVMITGTNYIPRALLHLEAGKRNKVKLNELLFQD